MAPLTPQLLVESGRVASINVAYQLLSRVAFSVGCEGGFVNFPDLTKATVHFKVDYFSVEGETSVDMDCSFQFRVHDSPEVVIPWVQ